MPTNRMCWPADRGRASRLRDGVDSMRVLHVISGLDSAGGGTTSTVIGLSSAQRAAGLDVSVVSSCPRPAACADNARLLRERGVRVTLIGPARGPLQQHPRLRTQLLQCVPGPDVVHVHALWEEIQHQAARLCRRLRVPYVWSPQGMLDPWSLSQRWLRKRVMLQWRVRTDLNAAAALHFATDVERELVSPLELRPRSVVEPLGVDLGEFATLPDRGFLRTRHPAIGQRRIVLFLSRIHYKKGLDLLIPAFARSGKPDEVLVLAGPVADGYEPELRQQISKAGIGDRVVFTGMLHGRDRLSAMVDADVFVLPSYQENFGIVVAEAMAAGCPVVISDQVNLHRDVSSAGASRVVPTQVEPLAVAIRATLDDREASSRMVENARRLVVERYDWKRIAERWVRHYERIIDRRDEMTPGV